MQFYTCPAGYCRCRYDTVIGNDTCVYSYSHTDPDFQCICDRRGSVESCISTNEGECMPSCTIVGTLCGECRNEGEGVSALLNDCVSCSNTSGLIILALGN